MFEVGQEYVFHVIENSHGTSGVSETVWKVEAVEGTLLKLSHQYAKAPEILNTASSRFVKAVAIDDLFPKSRNLVAAEHDAERWTEEQPTG